jgi:RNA polymerase sigma factor (TIGR02999 family)
MCKSLSHWQIPSVIMLTMTDVTRILNAIEQGDPAASDKLLPLVYEELRVLARQRLANEKPGQTLQATALVHEAYLRLVGKENNQSWDNRGHFFAAAAEAMRRILVEAARRKRGPRAGGEHQRVDLVDDELEVMDSQLDIVELSDALDELAKTDRRGAELVKLRFFAGLTLQQTAQALDISLTTAKSDWKYAKNWLRAALRQQV